MDNKELYGDVLQLREKHDAICSLVKKDKTISLKQGKYFMAIAFKKDFTGHYEYAFFVLSLMMILAVPLVLTLKKVDK